MTSRPLRYPLQYPIVIESASSDDEVSFYNAAAAYDGLAESDKLDIVMRLTLSEFITLFTLIDVASDIAYPEASVTVYDNLIASIVSMNICDSVSDCVENSTSVQNALQQFIQQFTNASAGVDTPLATIAPFEMSSVADDACNDRRYAGIREVIARIEANSVDFLEVASDTARDIFERADTLVEAIPALGDIGDIPLDFIQSAAQDALDEYQLTSTAALLETLACDVFCATENCAVTIDDFIAAYQALLPPSFNDALLETAGDILSWLMTGAVSSDTWFALVNLAQLFVLKIAQSWFGLKPSLLTVEFARGSNQPDNTWTTACGSCVPLFARLGGSGNSGITINNAGYGAAIYDAVTDSVIGNQVVPNYAYRSVNVTFVTPASGTLSVYWNGIATRAGGSISISRDGVVAINKPVNAGTYDEIDAVSVIAGETITVQILASLVNASDNAIVNLTRLEVN